MIGDDSIEPSEVNHMIKIAVENLKLDQAEGRISELSLLELLMQVQGLWCTLVTAGVRRKGGMGV